VGRTSTTASSSGRSQGPRPGAGLAAVVAAGLAELAEGDGVATGFGEEVPAVTEHVYPGPEPRAVLVAAELPSGGDHLAVVRGAAQGLDLAQAPQPVGGDAGGGEGLGDVLGDGLPVERLASAGQPGAVPDDPGVGLRAEPERHGLVLVVDDERGGGGLQAACTPINNKV
jgi:hypothetical protein